MYLILKKQAVLGHVNPGTGDAGCYDGRVYTDVEVFGGAAGFTFGIHYFVASFISLSLGNDLLSEFLGAYGMLNLILSVAQVPLYLVQAGKTPTFSGMLKAHLDGCGWTTACSIFWPLFWLPKIPMIGRYLKWTVLLRDLITIIDFAVSWFPIKVILNPITRKRFNKPTIPTIQHVDKPNPH